VPYIVGDPLKIRLHLIFIYLELKDLIYLRGQKFSFENDETITAAVRSWIRQCDPDLIKNEYISWKTCRDKCVKYNGGIYEKRNC